MTATTPTTMRAWQFTRPRNGIENAMTLDPSAAVPKPGANQHLVKIAAVALNPIDYKLAEAMAMLPAAEATPGSDFSGHIFEPAASSKLQVGQKICGITGQGPRAGGGLAEYAVVETQTSAVVPDGVALTDAATLGIAAITAYQSVRLCAGGLGQGKRIFINGGSGGTGMFGIQFAKILGAHVTTSCSTGNVDFCRDLGADEVIDYKTQDVLETLKERGEKFDHVVDNVGSEKDLYWQSHEFTTPEALITMVGAEVSVGQAVDLAKKKLLPESLGGMKRQLRIFVPDFKSEDFAQMAQWLAEGKLKTVIDEKLAFQDAPRAFERIKSHHAVGKVVVEVSSYGF